MPPSQSVETRPATRWWVGSIEVALIMLFFFAAAGDAPPAINEAHYLVKAKHYWDPTWLAEDLFVASRDAHSTFFFVFGWPTLFYDLATVAWLGRAACWGLVALGLYRCTRFLIPVPLVSLLVTAMWIAGVGRANLAGEWVIGGCEAKVPAYGFLLLGWGEMLRGRCGLGWVLLGCSAAFHVLVGGWGIIATLFARGLQWRWSSGSSDTKKVIQELLGGCLGFGLALIGLLPALALAARGDATDAALAAEIQVYGRLAHHLQPASFPAIWFLRHGCLILGFVFLAAHRGTSALQLTVPKNTADTNDTADKSVPGDSGRPLLFFNLIIGGSLLIAACGLVVAMLPALDRQLGATLLRFYWFRLSDALVPLGLSIAAVQTLASPAMVPRTARAIAMLAACAALVAVGIDFKSRWNEPLIPPAIAVGNQLPKHTVGPESSVASDQRVARDWMAVCEFIRYETPEKAIFLTPRHQQSFKWYAHRAEVVNWKDIPQDAPSVVQWARRINRVYPVSTGRRHPPLEDREIRQLQRDYGVTYWLVDRRVVGKLPSHTVVYPKQGEVNHTYTLYLLADEGARPIERGPEDEED